MNDRCRKMFFILLSSLLPIPLLAGGVFWSDRRAGQLKRMGFDGSGLETIILSGEVTSAGGNVRGIALDLANERIFWADNGADQILRANFDGSASIILHTIPTIDNVRPFPADVFLNPITEDLYWCDATRRHIERATLDGALVMLAISNAAPNGPYFMELDQIGGKIYWGDFSGGNIYRSNPDGSDRETLLSGNNSTRGVRIDTEGGMLYWINRNDKKVHRVPLSALGGGVTIPLTDPAVQTLYEDLDTPHGMTIDIPARKIYWADTGGNSGVGQGDSAVSRGDMDGKTPMEILATGLDPWDVEIDRRCRNYDEWRRRCFRVDAPSEQTMPDADPEGDLYHNALEYLFDLAPLHTGGQGLPETIVVSGSPAGPVYPAIRYRRRADTTDLTSWIEISTDLTDWEGSLANPATVEVLVTPLKDGMEEVTARGLVPILETRVYFMRVVVRLQPGG